MKMDEEEKRIIAQLTFIEDANLLDQKAMTEFLKLLLDPEGEVRMRALEKIGLAERKEHVDKVISALEDKAELVRTTALEIIGDWGVLSEYDKVVDALDDQDFNVLWAAIDALGDLGDVRAIPILTSRLPGLDDRGKMSCFRALAQLDQHKRDVWSQYLLGLIASPDYQTRCAVANSILDVWQEDELTQLVSRLKQALADENIENVAPREAIKFALTEIEELKQSR